MHACMHTYHTCIHACTHAHTHTQKVHESFSNEKIILKVVCCS